MTGSAARALSLSAMAAGLSRGEISVREVVEDALQRARDAASIGAFVALDEDGARRAAAASQPGPLYGVPVAIKDVIDVAGLPTRGGSAATDATPARVDAPIVARLRARGAIVIGKTATHELAYGVTTPAVTNPSRPSRVAGGSSGGSAAAVAAGIVPLALGTDTAGSVRIPATCCGVCGLISAPGTLPRDGVIALSESFDTLGPIVRAPADLALAWAALADDGPRGTVETSRSAPQRVRVVDPPELLGRVDPAALDAVQVVADQLGLPVTSATPPPFGDWGEPRSIVIPEEALRAHRAAGLYPDRADDLGAEIRDAHAAAASRPAERVSAARTELAELARRLRAVVGPGDILLTPALPAPPPERSRSNAEVVGRLTRLLAPINASNLVAAVVPEGPCGVQLVAADMDTLLGGLGRL